MKSGALDQIRAQILADSVNIASGRRVTSFLLRYPRYIHAELLVHRVFARNAASSRAIPVKTMLWNVLTDPAVPLRWGRAKRGMQDGGALPASVAWVCRTLWLWARFPALLAAWLLVKLRLHKQVANRLLEPWSHMTVVLTGTEWLNFYRLRFHKDAQPEMQALAEAMLRAHAASRPRPLVPGDWHIPFASRNQLPEVYVPNGDSEATRTLLKRATARCARASYENFYGKDSLEDDLRLHDDLKKNGHWSPFEHCCRAEAEDRFFGHLRAFTPYRKTFAGETHDGEAVFDPRALLRDLEAKR